MSQSSVGRSVFAVIAAYVAMFIGVFIGLTAAYLAVGTERAFQPNSFEVSALWSVVTVFINIIAALAGGWICATIARGRRAVQWLICVILVLGIISAIPVCTAAPPTNPRSGNLSNLEAMMQARMPLWAAVTNPLIGMVGVWLGALFRKSGEKA